MVKASFILHNIALLYFDKYNYPYFSEEICNWKLGNDKLAFVW